MKVLLDNRRRAWRVRLVLLGSLGLALAGCWWAVDLAQHLGLAPGDGGVLWPVGVRVGVAVGIGSLSLLPLLGMLMYVQLYAIRIERGRDGLHVAVLGTVLQRRRVLPLDRIRRATYVGGFLRTWRHTVHAPWINVWVYGDRLPYIVDGQASHVDTQALLALGCKSPSHAARGVAAHRRCGGANGAGQSGTSIRSG